MVVNIVMCSTYRNVSVVCGHWSLHTTKICIYRSELMDVIVSQPTKWNYPNQLQEIRVKALPVGALVDEIKCVQYNGSTHIHK